MACRWIVLGFYQTRECPRDDSLLTPATDVCESEAHDSADSLAQHANRLHPSYRGKKEVRILDDEKWG